MVTQIAARAGAWLDGVPIAAQDMRLEAVAAMLTSAGTAGTTGIAAAQGIRNGVGSPLACTWTSGLSFTLNAGTCFIQGTASATAGLYTATLDTTTTLAVTTADATNPRIDSVIAVVSDVGTSSSTTLFKILAGTAAPSPVAPTLPANALLLCNIAVAANAVALSAGVFTDKRVKTVCSGGILPYSNVAGATIAGPKGTVVYDEATDRFASLDGSGNARQPKFAPFAPVATQGPASVTAVLNSYTDIVTATVTTDGVTLLEVYAYWPTASDSTPTVGDYLATALTQDGGTISGTLPFVWRVETTSAINGNGGSLRAWTTPAAGTHTFALKAAGTGHNFTIAYPYIRVMASFQ